mmetsp:Transcript_45660/g.102911  ORF Transcript_45660/g.102911 Transcript_45660/m.102911 type:complete len:219 (+) Transcript_45660:613-1269(+)
MQPLPLLHAKIPLDAHAHHHRLAYLVHLRGHQSKTDGLHHPILHLIYGHLERRRDRVVWQLLALLSQRDEREQTHLLDARLVFHPMLLHQRRTLLALLESRILGKRLVSKYFQEPVERRVFRHLLKLLYDAELGEFVALEQAGAADGEQGALDQSAVQRLRTDVSAFVIQLEVFERVSVHRSGVCGVRVKEEPPELLLLLFAQLPFARPALHTGDTCL